jgi:hypothetical protein
VEANMNDPAPVLDVRTYKLVPGGREAVMALIENYHTIVIPLNALDLGRLDG